jgi:hypothetical protein
MRVRAFVLVGSTLALTIVSGCGSDTEVKFTDVRGDADTGGATSSSGGATSSGGIPSGMGGKGAAGSAGAGGTTATSGGSPGTGGTSGGAGSNSGGATTDGGDASVGGGAGGTLPDASIGDAGTEPDGGDGAGADTSPADAGSFCDRLGGCCDTVQPALRPSCRQYARAGTAVQCSVLIGLYCGAPPDAGPASDAGSGCDALSACCSRLGAQRQSCEQLVSTGVAAACDIFRAALCPP